MLPMNPRLTVIGSINADLTVHATRHPAPGQTVLGTGGDISAGGKGANQAVAASLQGANVRMVGAVGKDPYAESALTNLKSSDVSLADVEFLEEHTGLALITVSESGENTIVVVPGANSAMDAERVDAHAETIAESDMILVQGEIPASGFSAAIAHATGRVVINLAPVIEVNREDLLRANPLIANEHEAGEILTLLGLPSQATPEEQATTLRAAGFASVIITLGAHGSIVSDASETTHIPAVAVEPVETTGAGDAYVGTVAAKLLAGEGLVDAARHATRVAAFAVTHRGAQASYPDMADTLPGEVPPRG